MWFVFNDECGLYQLMGVVCINYWWVWSSPVLNLKDTSTLSIGQTGLGVRFALTYVVEPKWKVSNSYERNVHTSLLAVAFMRNYRN